MADSSRIDGRSDVPQLTHKISRVPVKIEPCFGDTVLGCATGFFYAAADRTFLVTNWHVVSGRNHETGTCLDARHSAIPDRLRLHVPFNNGPPTMMLVDWRTLVVPLYVDVQLQRPAWLVHPVYGLGVDVVAIPLAGLEETLFLPANDSSLELDDFLLYPSLDVFIVAFPRGMNGGGGFPIWKRGSIASEPSFNINGKCFFYIDAATREGMSGAPVYAEENGYWRPAGASSRADWRIGKGHKFVGVYASRVGTADEFRAQLGMVWKAALVEEIAREGIPGGTCFDVPESFA